MSISSQENMALLRNLLKDHPLLVANPQQFHFVFKKELERLHSTRFHYKSNLMVMNKEILKTFSDIKADMMREHQMVRQNQKQRKPREIHPNNNGVNLKIFEKSLEEKQRDFDKLMNKEKPKEIDFTDKSRDSPFTQNDLEYNMSQREAELAKIMQHQQKNKNVEAWLKGDTNVKPNNINIKIDHDSNVQINPIPITKKSAHSNKKRVTFEDEKKKPIEVNFFSKLKLKEENDNDDYKTLFTKMIDNQNKMIEHLKFISDHLKPKKSEIVKL
jgi:hypothetical protein